MKMITGSMENSTRQSQRPDVSAVQSQTCRISLARVELGRLIRKVFVPEEGYVFVDADYSQIELRVLAHCSGDAALIEAYREAKDIHRITASQVFPYSV